MLLHLVAEYFMNMSLLAVKIFETPFAMEFHFFFNFKHSSLNFAHDMVCFVAVRVPSVVDGICT